MNQNETENYNKCLLKLKVGDDVLFYVDRDGYCSFKKTIRIFQAKIVAKNPEGIPVLGIKEPAGLHSFWYREGNGYKLCQKIESINEYKYCYMAIVGDVLIASVVPKK